MQKILALILVGFTSPMAFGLAMLTSTPHTPIVVTSDVSLPGDSGPVTMVGPWFSVKYNISTDEMITVVGIQEIVTAMDGSTTSYYFSLPAPLEIAANTTVQTDTHYLGSLKKQEGFNYKVFARLIGWTGPSTGSGAFLRSELSFETR